MGTIFGKASITFMISGIIIKHEVNDSLPVCDCAFGPGIIVHVDVGYASFHRWRGRKSNRKWIIFHGEPEVSKDSMGAPCRTSTTVK